MTFKNKETLEKIWNTKKTKTTTRIKRTTTKNNKDITKDITRI
jgi:hypothetical protein